jgi:hypothetical protein
MEGTEKQLNQKHTVPTYMVVGLFLTLVLISFDVCDTYTLTVCKLNSSKRLVFYRKQVQYPLEN